MSARNPVTQTSFDRRASVGPRLIEGLLAPVEALVATAGAPGTSTARRLRLLGTVGHRVDSLFQARASALRVAAAGTAALVRRKRLRSLLDEAQALWADPIVPGLQEHGIGIHAWRELATHEHRALAQVFVRELFPLLTPLTVDATHPFPAVASLALNVAISARDRRSGAERFIGIEIPPTVPRLLCIPDSRSLVPVESVIGANLQGLLPDLEVVHHHTFRVTRDRRPSGARAVFDGLVSRTRRAVRLEVDAEMPPAQRALLVAGLGLDPADLDACVAPLDLAAVTAVALARLRARRGEDEASVRSGARKRARNAGGC